MDTDWDAQDKGCGMRGTGRGMERCRQEYEEIQEARGDPMKVMEEPQAAE